MNYCKNYFTMLLMVFLTIFFVGCSGSSNRTKEYKDPYISVNYPANWHELADETWYQYDGNLMNEMIYQSYKDMIEEGEEIHKLKVKVFGDNRNRQARRETLSITYSDSANPVVHDMDSLYKFARKYQTNIGTSKSSGEELNVNGYPGYKISAETDIIYTVKSDIYMVLKNSYFYIISYDAKESKYDPELLDKLIESLILYR